MWNCWKRSRHLTNNGHEGYNSRLKREVKAVHPNPNKLLMHIKKELMITELTARKYDMGGDPPAVKKKYRDLQARRQRLKQRLKDNSIKFGTYLENLGAVNIRSDTLYIRTA